MTPIRVLLVDDSLTALHLISRILERDPEIKIVGKAQNGVEALHLIPLIKPTIICTDYFMPKMDGLELTKQVMQLSPMPIIIMSGIIGKDSQLIFSILEAGALDFISKPTDFENEENAKALIEKIRILSKVYVIGKKNTSQPALPLKSIIPVEKKIYKIIVIGASTGGPQVLNTIFKALTRDYFIPIICIQHMSKGFLEPFVNWLKSESKLNMQIVKDREELKPMHIYFPDEDVHLTIDKAQQLQLSNVPPLAGHRPSIDVTMESVAQQYGAYSIGILLTGMGEDGAQGMKAISEAGGLTIVQDQATSVVFGMPKAAIDQGAAKFIMDPDSIGNFLLNMNKKEM